MSYKIGDRVKFRFQDEDGEIIIGNGILQVPEVNSNMKFGVSNMKYEGMTKYHTLNLNIEDIEGFY